MQCVILAGGLGTRISELTENKIPKCLIEINKKPFIDYQLQWLSTHGVNDIILCVGHLKEQVKNYVSDGSKWNLSVRYVSDGKKLLGTGGAIRKALDEYALRHNFIVMYGDSFLPINFNDVYKQYCSKLQPALITVFKNNNQFDISNADFNNGLVAYNKINPDSNFKYIDYGLSVLDRDIIQEYIPSETVYDLSTMFYELSKNNMLAGYEVYDRFYEVGSPSGLKDFQLWLDNEQANNT
jgi:NDP-sugar pyrophosphorylase family protein